MIPRSARLPSGLRPKIAAVQRSQYPPNTVLRTSAAAVPPYLCVPSYHRTVFGIPTS